MKYILIFIIIVVAVLFFSRNEMNGPEYDFDSEGNIIGYSVHEK